MRHARKYRQTRDLLDLLDRFNRAAHGSAQEHHRDAGEQAQQSGKREYHAALRRNGSLRQEGIVNQAHITHFASFHQLQLLHGLQQTRVQIGRHFHVARQAQRILLHQGQTANLAINALGFDLGLLQHGIHRLHTRVLGQEARTQLQALLLELA